MMAPLQELSMDRKELLEAIRQLLKSVVIPPNRSGISPACGHGTYRGKRKAWVGYHWTRRYSHFMTGLVYDTPLAWGDTLEEALAKLRGKAQ
jgi:hypothetical protein